MDIPEAMTPEQIVEGLLFASQTPLRVDELSQAHESLDVDTVHSALEKLRKDYDREERAFQIGRLADGYQILTRPELAPYLEKFESVPTRRALSRAALESLAVIAFRQPIGRIQLEEVRGVSCATVLRTLIDLELIEVTGRGEGLGRPLLYGTGPLFLEHFGLRSLDDLPRPEDLPKALGGGAEVLAEAGAAPPD